MNCSKLISGAVAGFVLSTVIGCGPYWRYNDPLRGAFSVQKDSFGDSVKQVVYLDQGWSPRDGIWFYTTTQGSRFIPYSWFLAIEQSESESPFRSEDFLRKFRFLPETPSKPNPHGLPVGFVKDARANSMGFTCAACHTTQINFEGTGIRIDGGPSLADFEGFVDALIASLETTLADSAKFERFAVAVLGSSYGEGSKSTLRADLQNYYEKRVAYNKRNGPPTPYGYARLDAFGRIFNRVMHHAEPDASNANSANAPVSYPFLWDTPMHDYVQWVGVAPNANLGSLARNVGEVVGVFAEFDLKHRKLGYPSSVKTLNLIKLEETVRKLKSPLWPEGILPPIAAEKLPRGKELYDTHCVGCHKPIDRSDPNRTVRAQMYKLSIAGTDPLTATNIATYKGKTGVLHGRKRSYVTGPRLRRVDYAANMVTNAVAGILIRHPLSDFRAELVALGHHDGGGAPKKEGDYDDDTKEEPFRSLLAYKARPLNGIWATAPYLHNGSVPNLYELLLPASSRSRKFRVGRREFDPVRVGFVTGEYPPGFGSELDTTIPGNRNTGHEYGTDLSEDDRMALVEYLKSL